jgi:UDP-glucose 4-epimerase
VIEAVTQVVHFAAYKNVGESMERPEKYWRNNVGGTVELVEGMLAAGVREIVFSSSCSVQGNPPSVPANEDAPYAPESVYAETKTMVEKILGWYGATSGLRAVSLRYFNAAGASDDALIGEDWTHSLNLVPIVMKATLGRRPPVQVFGNDYPTPDGTAIRTTSTSTTSRTRTCARCRTSPTGRRRLLSTSAPASAAASWR